MEGQPSEPSRANSIKLRLLHSERAFANIEYGSLGWRKREAGTAKPNVLCDKSDQNM